MTTHIPTSGADLRSLGTSTAQGPQAAGTSGVEPPAVALSIQNQMARLSMVQAHASKQAATEKMGELKDIRKNQQELLKALTELQSYKGRLVDRCNIKHMETLLNRYGISLTYHTEKPRISINWRRTKSDTGFIERTPHREYCGNDQTDVNIRALTGVKEQVTAQIQSAMTMLQDFMGQYQSYLEGARTAAAKANELTMKLATAR